ncbi:SRPBCC family protein [Leptospira sp. WS92.C1]
MKVVFGILAGIAALVAVFLMIGIFAEPKFEGKISGIVNAPVEKVFRHLLDLESIPKYRSEVTEIIREGKNDKGFPVWKERTDMGGYIHFEMIEKIENSRVEFFMKESSFGMKGTWDYRLEPQDNQTKITIVESSETQNILIRAIFVFFGKDANLKKELEILQTAFP